jgi:hypothetical protein
VARFTVYSGFTLSRGITVSDRPKTYNATDFKDRRAEIFREAEKHGECLVNHDRYPDVIFSITSRERGKAGEGNGQG